jgi:hypothetical protein
MIGAPQSSATTRTYTVGPLKDSAGNVVTTLLESDVFAWTLWAGDDQQALITGFGTLQSPSTAALVDISITKASLTSLPPGTYRIAGVLNPGVDDVPWLDDRIQITPGPGTAAAPKVYCSYSDLTDECSWIGELLDKNDQAGFAEKRRQARDAFEDLLHRHFRSNTGLTRQQALIAGVGTRRQGMRSPWLTEQLAANKLIITPIIVRANALFALGAILKDKIGSKGRTSYQQLAAMYAGMADDVASGITAEIDADGDGYGDVAIELGIVDTLRS